ncbi:transcription regulator protein, response regulator containing CheY-like receiver domain and HTH DNA-binding domain [Legionella steigerwaltii]|uniref:Transcription regulator protein, response regulator containing CheY-like receiver domain and HTH DNA-binding domain n=1 Tax=Legionella steigerwaltii TaxID=460 RepID=A0A378LF10_9GAMM|nr:helix-turn-helix transcriptional regulator [Legionella steigerwaltii]KTD77812.1 putative Transcriptional regulator, LuxR family protein [Legionella steigerwaltii]STY24452.1 transcription regulator protein, response regulator containing CheY-like receiver domain and HTH DNA-binding domain [Legionella steigerwaltii]
MNTNELINYSDYVNQICNDLFKEIGINHFSYVEISNQGNLIWLGSDSNYFEKCINQQLVKSAPTSILKTYPKTGFYLIDVYQDEYKQYSLPVFQLLNHFDYGHSFRILEIADNCTIKLYSFDAPLGKQDINHIYLNNLNVLKKFNLYFENKITFIRNKLNQNPFQENRDPEFANLWDLTLKQNNFIEQTFPASFYLSESKIQITPREKEVLFWYIKGKTSDETAKILNVSRRTIERHFENLREKFGCFSKSQIALKLMN